MRRRSSTRPSSPMAPVHVRKQPPLSRQPYIGTNPQQTILSISPTKLTLALPIPPSINHQYATVNGRRVLSSKGRQYKSSVAQQILASLATSSSKIALLKNLHTHSLNLSIKFYFTSALRRDIDGGLKIAQDAICDALDLNDNRIVEIHLYKAIDATYPRMECILSSQLPIISSSPKRQKAKSIRLHSQSGLLLRNSPKRVGRPKPRTVRKPPVTFLHQRTRSTIPRYIPHIENSAPIIVPTRRKRRCFDEALSAFAFQ